MTVEEIYVDGKLWKSSSCQTAQLSGQNLILFPGGCLFNDCLALNNDTHLDAKGKVVGDPTEIALFNIAKDKGFDKNDIGERFKRIEEIPFDSDRKCMTTFHVIPGGGIVSFTKGAVDVLIEKSENILTADGLKPVDSETIHRMNDRMAADGLRVLGVAMRLWDTMPSSVTPVMWKTTDAVGFQA
jgi:Ca2+-transporting ATPase